MTKKPSEPTVGRYMAEAGYTFGKPPMKMPVKSPASDVSRDADPDPRRVRQREACPPKRLLIGYEHARCNTNTDVILPIGVPDLTTVEAIDDFEPTVVQLADRNKPTCPICGTLMDFAVWGPHDDEVEGRWPIGSIDAR